MEQNSHLPYCTNKILCLNVPLLHCICPKFRKVRGTLRACVWSAIVLSTLCPYHTGIQSD